MALYVNNTPIRKLVKDNTVLHSLKINETEVFNDYVNYKITVTRTAHWHWGEYTPASGLIEAWYGWYFDYETFTVNVTCLRPDDYPVSKITNLKYYLLSGGTLFGPDWHLERETNLSGSASDSFSWTYSTGRFGGTSDAKLVINNEITIMSQAGSKPTGETHSSTPPSPYPNPYDRSMQNIVDKSYYDN